MTVASSRKNSPTVKETVVSDDKVAVENETVPDDVVETETEDETPQIPAVISDNALMLDFAKRYLDIVKEISVYNKAVLAEKSSEWNSTKVLDKARQMARPTEKDAKPDDDVKKALEVWEELINQVNRARQEVVKLTADKLGIKLTATAERNNETEAPLKEKRSVALTIGKQLTMLGEMTTDKAMTEGITEFFATNPVPAIGRDQVHTFGSDGTVATPKYRVKVEVFKGDELLLTENGFAKTGLALPAAKFGYERGQAPKSDALREIWEKKTNKGASDEPVEFTDNGLRFVITKK